MGKWSTVKIEKIAEINPRLTKGEISNEAIVSFVPMAAVGADDGTIDVSETRPFAAVQKGYTAFMEGDVLFAKITPCMENGKMAIVPQVSNGHGFGSTEFHVLRSSAAIDARYLYYFVSGKGFRQDAEHNMTGAVGQRRVPTTYLAEYEIPLPPHNEQLRIVAKIEELFSELDKGIESLKTAREQLKVYRQSLLKHAFEGKLTAAWRVQNRDKLESAEAFLKRIQAERAEQYRRQVKEWETGGKQGSKPKAPKPLSPITAEELAELPELPEGWLWSRLIETCEAVVDCHNKTAPYQSSGIPLVRTPSIRGMKLHFDDSIRFVSDKIYAFWSRRCPPLPGDILFTREAPMGEAAIIPEAKTVCMGQRIMLLRTGRLLSEKYLLYAIYSPWFKKTADKLAVGTGVKHLRVGDVERLTFPLCSLQEQIEIVSLLEAKLSEVDQLDQTSATALHQSESLRQSILKKAFSGRLVPQDPHDEPAAVLLERIRAEKRTTVKAGKSLKGKAGRPKKVASAGE